MQDRVKFTEEQRRAIYGKTGGCCANPYCQKTLSFNNRAHGQRGAWHVGHSRSLANGGTNHMNNLVPLCIGCNLDQGPINLTSYKRRLDAQAQVRPAQPELSPLAVLARLGLAVVAVGIVAALLQQRQPQQPFNEWSGPGDPFWRN